MARIKLSLPDHFDFIASIPVRITDINYGGHVGNDTILTLLHEARLQYLRHHGYTELELAGVALIMSDVAIEFKSELFYGDRLQIKVAAAEPGRVGFDVYYRMEKLDQDNQAVVVALAKTGMVCYDYEKKKVTQVPPEVLKKLSLG